MGRSPWARRRSRCARTFCRDVTGFRFRDLGFDTDGIGKLTVTDYEVVLFVNGQIKASINNAKVNSDKPTQLDFKLTGKFAANTAKKHTHMVYIPAETGSNLSGRWVEVDDTTGNSSAATAGTGHLDRGGNAMLKSLQGSSGTSGGGN